MRRCRSVRLKQEPALRRFQRCMRKSNLVPLVRGGRWVALAIGRVKFFSISHKFLGEVGRQQITGISDVDEIGQHHENREECP